MQAGEFTAVLRKERRRSALVVLNQETVVSEMWVYLSASGEAVAMVHQYRRYGGSLAASGKPDPKYLVHEGIKYLLQK
jgi:hypothetical protein